MVIFLVREERQLKRVNDDDTQTEEHGWVVDYIRSGKTFLRKSRKCNYAQQNLYDGGIQQVSDRFASMNSLW